MSVMLAALSGADLIHNVGYIEGCLTGSLQFLVMMDEAISFAKRVLRGIEVTPETLALDAIDRIGPGGDFLGTENTLRRCRTEFWYPTLLDRQTRESWEDGGRRTMGERVQEKLNRILDTHAPPPLPDDVQDGIEEVLRACERRVGASL